MYELRVMCKWAAVAVVVLFSTALSMTDASFAKAKVVSMVNGSSYRQDPLFWRRSYYTNKTLSPVIFGKCVLDARLMDHSIFCIKTTLYGTPNRSPSIIQFFKSVVYYR